MGLINEATDHFQLISAYPLVPAGSPASATPEWKGTTAATADGVDDKWTSVAGTRPFPDGASKGTINITFSSTTSSGFIVGQRSSSTPNVFIFIYWDSSFRVWLQVQTSAGNYIDSITANNTFASGVKVNLTATWDLGTREVKIYKDGVEVSYFAGHQDNVVGNPTATISTGADIALAHNPNGGGSPHTGHVEYPIFWDERVLTSNEASRLNTEINARILPIRDDEWRTKAEYDVDYTAAGGIGTVTDQFGSEVYGNSDGVNDAVNLTAGPYFTAANTAGMDKFTLAWWFKTSTATDSKSFWSQSDSTGRLVFTARTSSDGSISCLKSEDFFNDVACRSSTGYDDGAYHYAHLVFDDSSGTPLTMAIDGVDDTASSGGAGTPPTWPTIFDTLRIFSEKSSQFLSGSEQSVHKIWKGHALTAEQIAKDFANELSLLGNGTVPSTLLLHFG